MTRSIQSSYSPKALNKKDGALKLFKATAKQAGLASPSRVASEWETKLWASKKVPKPTGIIRRNPGRMDGARWNGRSFICAANVDEDASFVSSRPYVYEDEVEAEEDYGTNEPRREIRISISLFDIARPAKLKGVAKEFEVVDRVRRVIALDDVEQATEWWEKEDFEDDAEQWEEIYGENEAHRDERKLYSAALTLGCER